MQVNTRLPIKRGDTKPQFRSQCLDDDVTPVNLTGSTAVLVLGANGQSAKRLAVVIDTGTYG